MHHVDFALPALSPQIIMEPLLLPIGDNSAPYLRLGLLGVRLDHLGISHVLIRDGLQRARLLLFV